MAGSTKKLNCWEFKNCGREVGGLMSDVLGECPVARAMRYDGLNGGKAGGRVCWMVSDGVARREPNWLGRHRCCHTCDFYRRVLFEEDEDTVHRFESALP